MIIHVAFLLTIMASVSQPEEAPDPLTENEALILEEYERQESRFQRTAIRDITAVVNGLRRDLRDVQRDGDLSRNEKRRQMAAIRAKIDAFTGQIRSIREGDLVVEPYFDYTDMAVGSYGREAQAPSINGQNGFSRDNAPHLPFVPGVDGIPCLIQFESPPHPDGAIYEVVQVEDSERGHDLYTLRVVDIDSLRARRDANIE